MDYVWAIDGSEVWFTALPWIERQLVREWRTCDCQALPSDGVVDVEDVDCDDDDATDEVSELPPLVQDRDRRAVAEPLGLVQYGQSWNFGMHAVIISVESGWDT